MRKLEGHIEQNFPLGNVATPLSAPSKLDVAQRLSNVPFARLLFFFFFEQNMPHGEAHDHSVVQERLSTLRFVISSRHHQHSSFLQPPGTSGRRNLVKKDTCTSRLF
jgi:hypothetical protein